MANAKYTAPFGKCRMCGKVFEQVLRRGCARAYCSDECKSLRRRPEITKVCDIAGCGKLARSNGASWCEMHYMRDRKRGSVYAVVRTVGGHDACVYCGTPTTGQKYCSSRCAARSLRGNPATKACVICGKQFNPVSDHGPDANVCGPQCQKDRKRDWEQSRRALVADAFVEDVSRAEVMRRSKWRCHLCGELIPKSARWPDPMFGTVDHVMPIAAGGSHSYANCKAAHMKCNGKKGKRPLGQLGLPFAA